MLALTVMLILLHLLLTVSLLSIFFHWLHMRTQWRVLGIPIRWCRWILFSLFVAYLANGFGLTERPWWVVAVCAAGLWFFGETGYNWFIIRTLNTAKKTFTPHFIQENTELPWPKTQRGIADRDYLRQAGYTEATTFVVKNMRTIYLKGAVYLNPESTVRLCVFFIANKTNWLQYYIVQSVGHDGALLLTDANPVAFGGEYPKNWQVKRMPFTHTLATLLRAHQQWTLKYRTQPVLSGIIEDLNAQQVELQRFNEQNGYLNTEARRDTEGQLTPHGRYKLWKAMWILDYFGIFVR